MNREEMLERCKKTKNIEESDVWAISPIYCLLDFDKDDFCKLIDAIGLDKWVAAEARWQRLAQAEEELTAKENYIKAKARKEELIAEIMRESKTIEVYEEKNDKFIKQHEDPGEEDW